MRRLLIARRHLQFSLGTALLATTAFSIWLGLQTDAAHRQRRVVAEIRRLGGEVYYDWQIDENEVKTHQAGPPGPGWLRHWIGDDYFQKVVCVHLMGAPCGDNQLPNLETLKSLRSLSLEGTPIGDASVPRLAQLSQLSFLGLSETRVTDKGIDALCRATRLTTLWLCPAEPPTEYAVSDVGLKKLTALVGLERLGLGGPGITDASVEVLPAFQHLRELYLVDTALTRDGLARLRKKLPHCDVLNGLDE